MILVLQHSHIYVFINIVANSGLDENLKTCSEVWGRWKCWMFHGYHSTFLNLGTSTTKVSRKALIYEPSEAKSQFQHVVCISECMYRATITATISILCMNVPYSKAE